jgi:hypothetical protein
MEISMQFESNAGISREACLLNVSVVGHRPDLDLLNRTLETLSTALQRLNTTLPTKAPLYLIDNGSVEGQIASSEIARGAPLEIVLMHGHGNVGYGRGHNADQQSTT